jgi:UDP-N-acetylmuramyl pentapeptide synthase
MYGRSPRRYARATTSIAAAAMLKENIKSGDALLFKASRAVKLERLSEKIK